MTTAISVVNMTTLLACTNIKQALQYLHSISIPLNHYPNVRTISDWCWIEGFTPDDEKSVAPQALQGFRSQLFVNKQIVQDKFARIINTFDKYKRIEENGLEVLDVTDCVQLTIRPRMRKGEPCGYYLQFSELVATEEV